MKQKVKTTLNGKTIEGEFEVRNLLHFNIQRNVRPVVYPDKRKYNRKKKHKNLEEE